MIFIFILTYGSDKAAFGNILVTQPFYGFNKPLLLFHTMVTLFAPVPYRITDKVTANLFSPKSSEA